MTSHAQVMSALALANEIRLARAVVKRSIREAEEPIEALAGVLLDVPPCIETMTLHDLLLTLPRWGSWRVRLFLARLDLRRLGVRPAENRTVGSLTLRESTAIIAALRS